MSTEDINHMGRMVFSSMRTSSSVGTDNRRSTINGFTYKLVNRHATFQMIFTCPSYGVELAGQNVSVFKYNEMDRSQRVAMNLTYATRHLLAEVET